MDFNNIFGNKLMDRFFRKVDNVSWDLMTGKIGLVTEDGLCTLDKDGDEYNVSVNPIEKFGIPLPAFAQNTQASDVKITDVVYTEKKVLGWIVEIKDNGSFRILTPSGTTISWKPPKMQMFGFENGVLILRNLTSILPDGDKGLNGMKDMLLPMLMMGGNLDLDKFMPILLMGGGMGGNMMQTMMMMSMMNGGTPKGNTSGGPDFFNRLRM